MKLTRVQLERVKELIEDSPLEYEGVDEELMKLGLIRYVRPDQQAVEVVWEILGVNGTCPFYKEDGTIREAWTGEEIEEAPIVNPS
jgi:hypothetical protein